MAASASKVDSLYEDMPQHIAGDASDDPPMARTELVELARLVPHPGGPVTLADREGVFAHSFKCGECQLEFAVMSWKRSRHRASNTFCPECGKLTKKFHRRVCLSENRNFVDDGSGTEIFGVMPIGRGRGVEVVR